MGDLGLLLIFLDLRDSLRIEFIWLDARGGGLSPWSALYF
jgi:hypothetical protein